MRGYIDQRTISLKTVITGLINMVKGDDAMNMKWIKIIIEKLFDGNGITFIFINGNNNSINTNKGTGKD